MKKKTSAAFVATAAMIAALYVVLAYVSKLFGLDSGAIQLRLSEALTILPFFTPTAIPGLAIGCFLFNLLSGCAALDVIFGSLASLLGAILSYYIGKLVKKRKPLYILVSLPPVLSNALIVPWVLRIAYHLEDAYWYLFATVGLGELICCSIFGMVLLFALLPLQRQLFPTEAQQ